MDKENKLTKKYSLITAIAMVIGIVVGSGVFFKSEEVLKATNGNALIGTIAWIIGGIIMIICSYAFSILASKYQKINGLVDYAEHLVGKKYANVIGYLSALIWFPIMTAILAFLSASYLAKIFNKSWSMMILVLFSLFFIAISFVLNLFTPKLSGKYQVLSTYIKLIPLISVAFIGLFYGLITKANPKVPNSLPLLISNFKYSNSFTLKIFFGALVKTAFAYEGWLIATSINSEIKNPKKNLPRALLIGTFIIMAIYLSYYLGILGSHNIQVLSGDNGVSNGYLNLFGEIITPILNGFIFISCTGTLNGLMMANVRALYATKVRNVGVSPWQFIKLTKKSLMPLRAAIVSLLFTLFWFMIFVLQINNKLPSSIFDLSELPIIFMYCFYPLIFIMMIKKNKDDNIFKRYVIPILAIIASSFMIFSLIYSNLKTIDTFLFLCYLFVELLNYTELININKIINNNFMKGFKNYGKIN